MSSDNDALPTTRHAVSGARGGSAKTLPAFLDDGAQRWVAHALQHKRAANVTHALVPNGARRRDERNRVRRVLLAAEAHQKAAGRRV